MIGINIASSLKFEISKNISTILSERKGDPQKNEKDREDTWWNFKSMGDRCIYPKHQAGEWNESNDYLTQCLETETDILIESDEGKKRLLHLM